MDSHHEPPAPKTRKHTLRCVACGVTAHSDSEIELHCLLRGCPGVRQDNPFESVEIDMATSPLPPGWPEFVTISQTRK